MNDREIFANALEKGTEAERSAYLDEVCAGDTEMRRRIEALLREKDALGSFLESPTSGLAAALDLPIAEQAGATIGRYKLLEEIGEGGMGVVYQAEQQEPVRRQVALKIIKPGMDTRAVVARFEAERQALAMMDHPNIAHVLDGGATESGRPYFVMELFHGVPLTEYCDRKQLSIRERLELFVLVCQAVQHAHTKGIIHRDIKPSNVLVTDGDGAAVPKIIDFGIAKATGRDLTDQTLSTAVGQMIGTPLYMSPEQAGMEGLDIDARSDIYSLGVMLYELLTGTTPFERQRLEEAGHDEIRRMIREEEPPRPSTRISTLGEAATTVTVRRQSDPARLAQLLRRDLDWIVMKALEKDRTRRYQTASELARDIQRHLSDEPVEARPPSLGDRVGKWSRRHRAVIWSGLTVLLVALAALGVSSALLTRKQWQLEAEQNRTESEWRRAEAAEKTARSEQAKAEQSKAATEAVNRFLTEEILGQADPAKSPVGKPLTVLEALDRASQRVQNAFPDQPALKSAVHCTIAKSYLRLGEYAKSATHYRAALDLVRSAPADDPVRFDLAVDLGDSLRLLTQWDQSEKILRETLASSYRALGAQHATTIGAMAGLLRLAADREDTKVVDEMRKLCGGQFDFTAEDPQALEAIRQLASALSDLSQHEDADRLSKRVVELWQRLFGEDDPRTLDAMGSRCEVLLRQNKSPETEMFVNKTLDARRRVLGPEHPMTLQVASWQLSILWGRKQYAECEGATRQLLDTTRGALGPDHPDTVISLGNLANCLAQQNKLAEGTKALREGLEAIRRARGLDNLEAITVSNDLANLLLLQGEYAECEQLARRSFAAAPKMLGDSHSQTFLAMFLLLAAIQEQGRAAEADQIGKANINIGWGYEGDTATVHLLRYFGIDALSKGDLESAETNAVEAMNLAEEQPPMALAATSDLVGRVLLARGQAEAAEPHLKRCREIRRQGFSEGHWLTAESESVLGGCLTELNRYAEAEPLLVNSYPAISDAKSLCLDRKADALQRVITLYERWGKTEEVPPWTKKLESLLRAAVSAGEQAPTCESWSLADLRSRLGGCLTTMRRFDEASPLLLDAYEALASADLGQPAPHPAFLKRLVRDAAERIGQLYERQGQAQEAAAWQLLAGAEFAPRMVAKPDARSKRIEAARDAVSAWENLLPKQPERPDWKVNLGAAYRTLGLALCQDSQPKESLAAYVKAVELLSAPHDETSQNLRGRVYLRLCYSEHADALKAAGRYEEASTAYERAIRVDPADGSLLLRAAWHLAHCPDPSLRNAPRAIELASRSLELDTQSPQAWLVLGTAQYREGHWTEAVQSLSKARGSTVDWLFLGMAEWQLGNRQEARLWYEKAVARMKKAASKDEELLRFSAEATELLGVSEKAPAEKRNGGEDQSRQAVEPPR